MNPICGSSQSGSKLEGLNNYSSIDVNLHLLMKRS